MTAKRCTANLVLAAALTLGVTAATGSTLLATRAEAAGQIHTGGKLGAYHSTFCPRLKKVLDDAHFPFECQVSEGTSANIERVKDAPGDIGFAQLDVFALDKAENGPGSPLKRIRSDLGRECLFLISKDPTLENFGDVSNRASDLKFVLPPQGSGHTATFRFLQKIDPDGLGRATNITYAASTIDAVEKALNEDTNTVTVFVQFPDPSNARFKLVNAMDGHFIPVIDRNILRQSVDCRGGVGDVSNRASDLKFVLPPQGSGHTATFRFLQKIDPDGLGRATNITYAASTIDAVEKALNEDTNTVTVFVQFPDPSNARFKLVNAMDGHFIPVIDRNILRQSVDGEKVYFAEETLVANPKFWKKGSKAVTACTPIVVFSGNPDHFPPGQDRVDQQDMIRTVKAAPQNKLLPQDGILKSIWKETKSMSAGALAKLLDATEKAREAKIPSLEEIKEKTKDYSRKAMDATKE